MSSDFIDSALIEVHSGKGGDGCASFRRERCIPLGGPDGGDGGAGGSVVFVSSKSVNTLAKFRFNKIFKAKPGANGMGKQKYGANADNIVITLPLGTKIYNRDTGELMLDLLADNQEVVIAQGGEGGRGNIHFKSSVNRSPRQFAKGDLGHSLNLRLELSVLADVGLLGLPNAGKSSFIRKVSAATPTVADYPFTTKRPYLGVVAISDHETFVMADIPGLIAGAAGGAGMGVAFLKHLSRTRLLLHVVDIFQETFIEDIAQVVVELAEYGHEVAVLRRIIVLNKIDLIDGEELAERVALVKSSYPDCDVYAISALAGIGVNVVKYAAFKAIGEL